MKIFKLCRCCWGSPVVGPPGIKLAGRASGIAIATACAAARKHRKNAGNTYERATYARLGRERGPNPLLSCQVSAQLLFRLRCRSSAFLIKSRRRMEG